MSDPWFSSTTRIHAKCCEKRHNSSMVKKQAGDMSPEKLRLGPGAKTRAFDVAPENDNIER